jgi:AbrB family looped-hinge helix DNA binding protein
MPVGRKNKFQKSRFPKNQLCGNAAMRHCPMTTVVPISKRGAVTLPPALRRKFGFGAGENPLIVIEERDGEIVLRPASAVTVRDIPAQVIQGWIAEDEAGMREFESLARPS